jgi:formamidopyrimidine-DNA glycosylase
MPELPDVAVYVDALERRITGQPVRRVKLLSPFLLRTAVPPISSTEGKRVVGIRRIGKRIVLALEGDLFLVLHLMIAGRLRWLSPGEKPPGRITLAVFEFPEGALAFTEAGTKRRASLHLVQGEAALAVLDAGGLDVFHVDLPAFSRRLKSENHTLKRALTDPRLFSGIGNAYSDEILHRARLSPIAMTATLSEEQAARLFEATRSTLAEWTERL